MSIESVRRALERIDRAIDEPNNTMSDAKALKEIFRQLKLAQTDLSQAITKAEKQGLKREWVGLTDEEWQDISDRLGLIIFGSLKREIEAKLKEKNT